MPKSSTSFLGGQLKKGAIWGASKALPRMPRAALDLFVKKLRKDAEKFFKENPDNYEPRQLRFVKSFVIKLIDLYLINSKRLSSNCRYKMVNNLGMTALHDTTERMNKFKEEEGFRPPSLIVLSPTMRCNLQCEGCYAFEYNKTQEGDIPFDVLVRTLEEARSMGIAFIVISGGEPFMRKDELIKIFKKFNDMFFIIYTNGQLIDKDCASELEKAGNAVPCISVEGYKDETDQRRGGGVHDKVVEAMKNLKDKGVPFAISVTMNKNNVDLVTNKEFFEYYIEKGAIFAWYFQYIPIGREPSLDLMLTAEQRNISRQRILAVREGDLEILPIDFWGDGYLSNGCIAAGIQYVHISGTGWIEPCVFTHFAVHNIKDTTIREALKSKFMQSYRKKQEEVENRFLPCGIVDHPKNLRDAIKEAKEAGEDVRPTHPGADTIVNELAEQLDEMAAERKKVVGEKWDSGEA